MVGFAWGLRKPFSSCCLAASRQHRTALGYFSPTARRFLFSKTKENSLIHPPRSLPFPKAGLRGYKGEGCRRGAGWHRALLARGSLLGRFTPHCQSGQALNAYAGLYVLIVFALIRALGHQSHTRCWTGNPHPVNFLLASAGHPSLAMAVAARKGTATASPLASSPVAIATTARPGFLGGWLSRIPREYSSAGPALSGSIILDPKAVYPLIPPSKSPFPAGSGWGWCRGVPCRSGSARHPCCLLGECSQATASLHGASSGL